MTELTPTVTVTVMSRVWSLESVAGKTYRRESSLSILVQYALLQVQVIYRFRKGDLDRGRRRDLVEDSEVG